MAEAAVTASKRSRLSFLGSSLQTRQTDALQSLVTKHITDPALSAFSSSEDFTLTSTDRGLRHWEHGHLVAALDILNAYQKSRRAKKMGISMNKQYKNDPRTRLIELLKRWLRTNAGNKSLNEEELRRICSLCRGIMDHQHLFVGRNTRSFMHTLADVYKELQLQLREVLEKDRTCAELAQQVLSLSRNFISDAIGYLLVAPTDLKQTDKLPSLEAVALLPSLPAKGHPLPARISTGMQHDMRDAWRTHCGLMIAALLRSRTSLRLFEGASAQEEAAANAAALKDIDDASPRGTSDLNLPELIEWVAMQQEKDGNFRYSGLAGPFRKKECHGIRKEYISAVQLLQDLIYLLGEALVHFHRISDGLGDYGMIRVAVALHPFLDAIVEKVQCLKKHMENLNAAVDKAVVLPTARGESVTKPVPSERMRDRAHGAIERAVTHNDSHVQLLVKAIDELRARSSPDRLPHVMNCIADACVQLDAVLSSPQFRACVGDKFPALPRLADVTRARVETTLPIMDVDVSTGAQYYSGCESGVIVEEVEERPTPSSQHAVPSFFEAKAAPVWQAAAPPDIQGEMFTRPVAAPSISATFHAGAVQELGSSICPKMKPAPVWPIGVHSQARPELKAEVCRMAPAYCGPGLRRHDRRSLRLTSDGLLEIYEKSSKLKVKHSLDAKQDIEALSMISEKVMCLVIRIVPKNAAKEHGVFEHKEYRFEFQLASTAAAFQRELSDLSSGPSIAEPL